jgi:TolA-binding protein
MESDIFELQGKTDDDIRREALDEHKAVLEEKERELGKMESKIEGLDGITEGAIRQEEMDEAEKAKIPLLKSIKEKEGEMRDMGMTINMDEANNAAIAAITKDMEMEEAKRTKAKAAEAAKAGLRHKRPQPTAKQKSRGAFDDDGRLLGSPVTSPVTGIEVWQTAEKPAGLDIFGEMAWTRAVQAAQKEWEENPPGVLK